MDERTQAFLLAPPPLADPALRVDPVVATSPAAPGLVTLTTTGGRELVSRVSSPAAGVVRVQLAADLAALRAGDERWAASPMLVIASADPVDPSIAWDGAALGVGVLRAPPGVHTLTGSDARLGPLLDEAGDVAGWLVPFALGADDAVYGGGECFAGPDLRGRVRHCVNIECHGASGLDASYLSVPFVWSDAGWGVYAHTGAPVRIDCAATHPGVVAFEVPGAAVDLFCYTGDAPAIIAAHQRVTGLPGALPDWALGVWTSRCSYLSAAEVDEVLDGYAAADCPVDVVHVDAWQEGNVVADLTTAWRVDRDRWPVGWSKTLADRGVRLSLWHNPYLREGTAAGDEAVAERLVLRDAAGALVTTNDMPDRRLVDFTDPRAVAWWGERVTALGESEGASSVKADFGEEVPPAAVCADGRTGWEVRNEYALRYQEASARALRDALDTDDVVMFSRSGTAGAQRNPGHWVGDTPSTWPGLATALRACLSLSLSGFAVVASDVGGFWTERAFSISEAVFAHNDPAPFTADVDPELFVRWAQFGALSPLMRFHGFGRREPWAYAGEFGAAAVAACRLRARLRPYLARVAAQASVDGTPMMRPMPLAYAGDRAARDASLQYLLGPDILAAPVLEAGGHVRVWVPTGEWRGLHGAPLLRGPAWHEVTLALDALPVWVRPGAEVLP